MDLGRYINFLKEFGTQWKEDDKLAWNKGLLRANVNYENEGDTVCDCATELVEIYI